MRYLSDKIFFQENFSTKLTGMEENKRKSSRQIRLCQSWRRVNKTPILTLEGLWLQQSGFDIGDLVQVIPGKEELTVKIIEKWKSGKSNSV